MVRELDLKKPPSIAESIDWARALLLLGADDIDGQVFADTMSIIVKHRTDLDVVAERVGVKLGLSPMPPPPASRRAALLRRAAITTGAAAGASSARILELGEELRGEGVAVGTSELLDAFAVLREVPLDRAASTSARRWPRRWPSPRTTAASSTSSSIASSSAPPSSPPSARASPRAAAWTRPAPS